MTIWLISFLLSLAFIDSLSFFFWTSFTVFGLSSCYVAKNEKRIFRELEEFEKRLKGK